MMPQARVRPPAATGGSPEGGGGPVARGYGGASTNAIPAIDRVAPGPAAKITATPPRGGP